MNNERAVHSLGRLVALRERDVERLGAALAVKEAERQRYRNNLQRMEALVADIGADACTHPLIALNCADYKGTLLNLIRTHAGELAAHEAGMAAHRALLEQARCKHKSLATVYDRKAQCIAQARDQRERKGQDQLATQAWLHQRHGDGFSSQRT